LAVVMSRVRSMNGRIELRSAPGAGTTFVITVPIVDPNHVRRSEQAA
jgi:signal transduction histidine kinase